MYLKSTSNLGPFDECHFFPEENFSDVRGRGWGGPAEEPGLPSHTPPSPRNGKLALQRHVVWVSGPARPPFPQPPHRFPSARPAVAHRQQVFFGMLIQNPPLEDAHAAHNAPLAAFLFRPVARIVEYQRALRRHMGLRAYSTVHVRGTDKLPEEEWLVTRQEDKELAKLTPKVCPGRWLGCGGGWPLELGGGGGGASGWRARGCVGGWLV